jgi:ABC-type Fe3+ transport system substrate-binding protein
MISNKIDFSMIALEDKATKYLADNSLNVHISMPCPLKVPFHQMFAPIVENYNSLHPKLPIHCPNISDCSSVDIEDVLKNAKDETALPDIIITTNFRILFANGFYDRFVANHIYEGVMNPKYADKVLPLVSKNLLESNIGVWSFSSWSFVQDLTADEPADPIDSWSQLISPEMKGKITVHGHVDKATFSLAYFLQNEFGNQGLRQYAQNVGDIKHFSQAIKRLNSSDPNKTLLTMLPDVAISKIPSNKKIKVLDLKEAKVLSPMIMMVKHSKMEACREILNILWSEPFEALLADAGGVLPYKLDREKTYFLPDFKEIAHTFEKIEAELDKIYIENLPWTEIESKTTEGGTCK